jgi:hypothetical protein
MEREREREKERERERKKGRERIYRPIYLIDRFIMSSKPVSLSLEYTYKNYIFSERTAWR